MASNLKSCCRICLDMESKQISILENPAIHLHIKSCLPINISINDELPKAICESCVSQLNEFYNFQLNARCSQDWLESSLQEETKKSADPKIHVQPLPDSEYNSDSLLEFLNNTENIEEYLNNLGKEDIPSIVNMLDKAEGNDSHKVTNNKLIKIPSPKKKDSANTSKKSLNMDIDVLDSDIEIVKELLVKEIEPKKIKLDKTYSCFACKAKLSSIQKLSHHLSICDNAVRTCVHCNILFDSKQKMRHHALTHSVLTPLSCNCGQEFESKEKLLHHSKKCEIDHIASMGFSYSCKICGEKFSERFQLFKHARAHILKSEERECKLCGSKFVGDDALLKHEKKLHGKDNKVLLR